MNLFNALEASGCDLFRRAKLAEGEKLSIFVLISVFRKCNNVFNVVEEYSQRFRDCHRKQWRSALYAINVNNSLLPSSLQLMNVVPEGFPWKKNSIRKNALNKLRVLSNDGNEIHVASRWTTTRSICFPQKEPFYISGSFFFFDLFHHLSVWACLDII